MWSVREVVRKGKSMVLQYSEIEAKTREATSNEKWGPTGTQMGELARATHSYNDYPIIMRVIWERFDAPGKNWRQCYKALLLLDYLLKNGSDQVARESRVHLVEIQTLTEFQYIDEEEKDAGHSIRERAKAIVELLHDQRRLNDEREKAAINKGKFSDSISSERSSSGYGGYASYDPRPPPQPKNFVAPPPPNPESDEDSDDEKQQQPPQQQAPAPVSNLVDFAPSPFQQPQQPPQSHSFMQPPQYQHQQNSFNPNQGGMTNQQNLFNSQQTQPFNAQSQFNPQNQQFNPQNQQFNPQNQQFNPQNQQFNPQNQQFNSQSQPFNPQNQPLNTQNPFNPQSQPTSQNPFNSQNPFASTQGAGAPANQGYSGMQSNPAIRPPNQGPAMASPFQAGSMQPPSSSLSGPSSSTTQPKPQPAVDLFSSPIPQPQTSNPFAPSQQSTQTWNQPTQGTTNQHADLEWDTFTKYESETPETKPAQSNDPWAQTKLFNLTDLEKKSQSASSPGQTSSPSPANKVPIGSLSKTPIGAKPIGSGMSQPIGMGMNQQGMGMGMGMNQQGMGMNQQAMGMNQQPMVMGTGMNQQGWNQNTMGMNQQTWMGMQQPASRPQTSQGQSLF